MRGWRLFAAFFFSGLVLNGCAPSHRPDDGPRIVSLAPNLTEIVFAVGAGDLLVGRTSACDYPAGVVDHIPIVGGFGAPALDRLLQTHPTLVLDVALEDEAVGKLMDRLGIRRVRVPCATVDDIPRAILQVGQLAGRHAQACALAEELDRRLKDLRAQAATRAVDAAPAVFAEIWSDPLMTVGRKSFIAELIRLAGGRNIGDEIAERDYFPISGEWVIKHDPEIVLCLYMTPKMGACERLAARQGWQVMRAIRANRVYGGFDNNLILRPGPRVLEGIAALRQCIKNVGVD